MYDFQRDYGLESLELSDAELDLVAGGAIHEARYVVPASPPIRSELRETSTHSRPADELEF
jgi:hypothetical protein